MTQRVRTIVYASTVGLLLTALVVGLTISHCVSVVEQCPSLVVDIQDLDERQFLSADQVELLLRQSACYPVGMALTEVDAQAIEKLVQTHPMVRQAECYLSQRGVCHIRLTQRVPAYRVTTSAEVYWVDTDRRRMPYRTGIAVDVPAASGSIGERMATHELYDLMQYIAAHTYWREKLTYVEILSPQMTVLHLHDGSRTILGPIAGYEAKLGRLQKLWKATAEYSEAQAQVYDLRFEGQVVTR